MSVQDLAPETPAVEEPRHVIANPFSGERIVILTHGEETGGQLLVFELVLPPGKHVPSRHTHPLQEEQFTILSGTIRFQLGWRTVLAKPGDTVTVPRGVAHWFGNPGPTESRARVEVRPALRTEQLFETTARVEFGEHPSLLSRARQLPNIARMLVTFRREVAVPDLPDWIVHPLLTTVARIGQRDRTDPKRPHNA